MRRITIFVVVGVLVALIVIAGVLIYYYSFLLPSHERNVVVFTVRPQDSRFVDEYLIGNFSSPNGITVDSLGRVWFSLENETSIGFLSPANGTVHLIPLPEPEETQLYTWSLAVDNSRQLVWFPDQISGAIWVYSIANGSFQKYALETGSFPLRLTLDSQGNVWFTELAKDRIGEITTGGMLNQYDVPAVNGSSNNYPTDIAVDSNGTVWFTEPGTNSIGEFKGGQFTQFYFGNRISSPSGITLDSKGNVWFTQHGPSFFSEFNPKTGALRTFSSSIPSYSDTSLPYWIQIDSSGNVWFNEHEGNAIAKFDPSTNGLVEYEIPSYLPSQNVSADLTFALSPQGIPWFSELFTGKIGTVNTSAPLTLSLSALPNSVNITNGNMASIRVNVNSTTSTPVALATSVANFSENFEFNFSPSNGTSSFASTLVVKNSGSAPGVYMLTITAETPNLRVSQIVVVQSTP
jgi:virginiamycin B lyase